MSKIDKIAQALYATFTISFGLILFIGAFITLNNIASCSRRIDEAQHQEHMNRQIRAKKLVENNPELIDHYDHYNQDEYISLDEYEKLLERKIK